MDALPKDDYEKEIDAPFTDSLTGLFNHGFFQICLEREIRRSERHGAPFSLALIDIDFFSTYNRRWGSLQADKILKDIGSLVKRNIREVDLAARYLGDVLAIIFVMSDSGQVLAACERIRSAVEQMSGGKVTVSVGLASFERDMTREGLIKKAQEALSQAKIRGKNRIHCLERGALVVHEEKPRVLVVDDEPLNLKLLEASLLPLNYQVLKASNGDDALQVVQKSDVDLILLDRSSSIRIRTLAEHLFQPLVVSRANMPARSWLGFLCRWFTITSSGNRTILRTGEIIYSTPPMLVPCRFICITGIFSS